MATLTALTDAHNRLDTAGIIAIAQRDSQAYRALERILKGYEIPLNGAIFTDKDGNIRSNVRLQWWLPQLAKQPIKTIVCGSPEDVAHLDDRLLSPADCHFSIQTHKPIFIGHYWLTGTPRPLSEQVVCVDYAAGKGGLLTAYQFNSGDYHQNQRLTADNFIQYDHIRNPFKADIDSIINKLEKIASC